MADTRGGRALFVAADGSCIFDAVAPQPGELYVGELDGVPCFASDVEAPPVEASPTSLRAALLALPAEALGVVASAAQLVGWDDEHRFCSRCAAPLTRVPNERAKACDACGLHFYPRISPCVITVVHDGDRILLAHKAGMPFFALVAGFVEAGESLEDAVRREVAEETNAQVGELRFFGSQPWPFPHQLMVGFYARYAGGDIRADERELDEVRWFHRDAMPPVPRRLTITPKMIDAWVAGSFTAALR